jgi:hypothetical protein
VADAMFCRASKQQATMAPPAKRLGRSIAPQAR